MTTKPPRVTVVDFETHAIEKRHIGYPPVPVGVAVWAPGESPRYYAWGHPVENNTSITDGKALVERLWRGDTPLLFHNAKFDVEVAAAFVEDDNMLVPRAGLHDTLPMLFLHDPHAQSFSLKPSAERLLGDPPTERDAVKEWVITNVDAARKKKSEWGAHIAKAPGKLVGRYAIGDVKRTKGLFMKLAPTFDDGLWEAYRRELALIPILIEYERRGVRVDLERLAVDTERFTRDLDATDAWLRTYLKAPALEVDSNDQLADAIDAAGKVTAWRTTATGKRSTARDALMEAIDDWQLMSVLTYRGKLATRLRTFARPWVEMASASKGYIFTEWFSARGDQGGGARTGRMSSRPNFQNVPREPEALVTREPGDGELRVPASLAKRVGPLPHLRDYIVADPGCVLINRDYSQQELRILGHYEDGVLLQSYRERPTLDMHDEARTRINTMLGTNYGRKPVKNLNFGVLYGMGLDKLAHSMGVDRDTAQRLRNALLEVFPGLRALDNDLKRCGREREPIRTWGGRLYYVEPPRFINGQLRVYDYKLLNVLIQGSAADCTKQALVNYDADRQDGRVLLAVHDEILVSTPRGGWREEMARLRHAMERVAFDVPMLSEGKANGRSWAQLVDYKDPRRQAAA